MKKGTHIQIEITTVGFKGVGIGVLTKELNNDIDILDEEIGKKVLVQNTLAGEIVIAEVKRNKPNYIEGEKITTVKKSPLEITPRCKHFHECGGCKWQNLSYENQLKIKEDHVRDLFIRTAQIDETIINDVMKKIVPCQKEFRYRNKMELSLGYDKDMKKSFGMHVEGRRYDIFNMDECFLMSEKMLKVGMRIKDFLFEHDIEPFRFKTGEGVLRSVFIREGTNTGLMMVEVVCGAKTLTQNEAEALLKLLKEEVDSLYLTSIIAKRGSKTRRESTLLYGVKEISDTLTIKDRTFTFSISPSSFFQPNTTQAETLYNLAIQNLNLTKTDKVMDLFCGTGTIGIIMSDSADDVIGIEINPDAVIDAKKNAKQNKADNTEFICGDVGKILEQYKSEGKLETLTQRKLIIDPPRAGLSQKMIELILELEPTDISYVSCNPATQARDVALFIEAGFKINSIQPVDMFPHTYHIENIVSLSR